MADGNAFDEVVRRLAAAVRGSTLYSPDHPVVRRGVETLATLSERSLLHADSIAIGSIGDDVVVNGERLGRSAATLIGFVRELRDQQIEKITIAHETTRDEVPWCVRELADRRAPMPLQARLKQRNVRHITVGRIHVEQAGDESTGITAARRVYASAVRTARQLWEAAKAGDKPDPNAVRKIVDNLARLASQDRTSLMALTALKRYDNYTFTHMVNVSVLAMATDPFRPQVKVLLDRFGHSVETPSLVNAWEPDGRGDFRCAVVEAVDPDSVGLDSLSRM